MRIRPSLPLSALGAALILAPAQAQTPCDPKPILYNDGWNGAYPLGKTPPDCRAADAWITQYDQFGLPRLDSHGKVVKILDSSCKHYLSPLVQAQETACTPCSNAAVAGPLAGTADLSVSTSVRPLDMTTTEKKLAEFYCEMEGSFKQNLDELEEEIERGVSGELMFGGGTDTRTLEQKDITPGTMQDAEKLRNRRSGSIEKLGEAAEKLEGGLNDGTGGVDWTQVTDAGKQQARGASEGEKGKESHAPEGVFVDELGRTVHENRSGVRTAGAAYSEGDPRSLKGEDLKRELEGMNRRNSSGVGDRAPGTDEQKAQARGRGKPDTPEKQDLPDVRLFDRLWNNRPTEGR